MEQNAIVHGLLQPPGVQRGAGAWRSPPEVGGDRGVHPLGRPVASGGHRGVAQGQQLRPGQKAPLLLSVIPERVQADQQTRQEVDGVWVEVVFPSPRAERLAHLQQRGVGATAHQPLVCGRRTGHHMQPEDERVGGLLISELVDGLPALAVRRLARGRRDAARATQRHLRRFGLVGVGAEVDREKLAAAAALMCRINALRGTLVIIPTIKVLADEQPRRTTTAREDCGTRVQGRDSLGDELF